MTTSQDAARAFEQIIDCYERNNRRQNEKLDDIPNIARRGLDALRASHVDTVQGKGEAVSAGDLVRTMFDADVSISRLKAEALARALLAEYRILKRE